MSLEHTLVERPDLAAFLAEAEPPPMSSDLREATAELARELAGAWSHGALPAGVQLGDYTIQEPLGHGGQASVYRAEGVDGKSYAVKVPRQELLERLIREAQILFHLDHPRVVRIITAEVKGSPPYLVTEHLTGGTLGEVLEAAPRGQLPPERVRELGLAVLDALSYAHAKGVIHRDLKPSNILFDAGGEAKVADFGIGSLSLVQRLEGTLVSHDRTGVAGTPLYMAPEQELRGAEVDGRADLYALGKVVYRALSGRSPRTIKPLRRVLPGLDLAWEDFILRLVEDDPGERYPSAEAARAALLALPAVGAPAASARAALDGVELETNIDHLEPKTVQAEGISSELARLRELSDSIPPGLPAQERLPGLPSDPTDSAPWATGYVVDQILAVAQRLSATGQGGLFAFTPQPWEPSATLRSVRSGDRSLGELEDLLALEPLGVAIRGRTIRATFEPQGTESRQAWLEAALAEQLLDPISHMRAFSELFLVDDEGGLVARVGEGASDWVAAAEAHSRGEREDPNWITLFVNKELRLLAPVPGWSARDRQLAFDRLTWLDRRVSLLGAEGWRRVSPGSAFDTTIRNRAAAELARDGALVLHVEPSGRWLVYSGQGVQATRSVSYLRRLLEGGLGLLGPNDPPRFPREPAPKRSRAPVSWLLALATFLAGSLGLLVAAPKLQGWDLGAGILGLVGATYCAWEVPREFEAGRGARGVFVARKVFALVILLMVIGVAVSLLEVALR